MMDFNERLDFGRIWEMKVSAWLQENDHYVLNVYEYTPKENGVIKSPKLHAFPKEKSLVAPDLQAASEGITHWIEVKAKNSCGYPFASSGNTRYRTTGIGLTYWYNYLDVQEITGIEVFIFFVHVDEREVRSATLSELNDHARRFIHSGAGMIYWPYDELQIIATINDDGELVGAG